VSKVINTIQQIIKKYILNEQNKNQSQNGQKTEVSFYPNSNKRNEIKDRNNKLINN